MKKREFSRLAQQGYQRIPLTRTRLADLDTPVSTYLKMANAPYSYLLESVQGGERWGRYSFIGLAARQIYKVRGYELTIVTNGEETTQTLADPLGYIGDLCRKRAVPQLPGLPRFYGGLVGYFAYECVGYTEPRLQSILTKPDPLNCPHILMLATEELIVFDNLLGKIILICYARTDEENGWQRAQERLDQLEAEMARPLEEKLSVQPGSQDMVSGALPTATMEQQNQHALDAESYRTAVQRIKTHIKAGDVMQVVPSQRMCFDYPYKSFDFYRLLRTVNPAPYMFYFDLGAFHLAGASPEILVRLEDDTVTLRPIAGTRPRGTTPAEDQKLEQEMLADPKERAEHVMLIDLGRNDVGRIATIGSVRVTDSFVVERYSRVMHIVSNVCGTLRPGLNAIDVLRAALPAGTLSGAPKIRAIEIINELEPHQRGIYGGALGYLGWNGNMDLCICIRTIVIQDSKIYVQAGGGIVADSQPQSEWEETLNKRRAIFQVLNMLNA